MHTVNEENQRLKESLDIQAMELSALRLGESKAKVLADQLTELQEKFEKEKETAAAKEKELRDQVDILTASRKVAEVDRQDVVTKVVPYACYELMKSEEAGEKIADCINTARTWERALVLEEIAATGKPVVLSERADYNNGAYQAYEAACDALEQAQFPFVLEIASHPNASVEELLSMKPKKSAAPLSNP